MKEPAKTSKRSLRARFRNLARLREVTQQQRGFELERLFVELARGEGLTCRAPFRGTGEQTDGLVVFQHWHFLLEAKWLAGPVPLADIYSFRSKVESKLVGTLGLFISVNGFAKSVPDVLRYGKELNVLLMDGSDLESAMATSRGLRLVLAAKVLRAIQHGEVYYAFRRYVDERTA